MRPVPYILFALMLSCSSRAIAEASADPFLADSMPYSRPAPRTGSVLGIPCEQQSLDRPLSLPEVVDLALCRNPQTREAWANSFGYAAQVGVSRAAYLPSASLNASLNRNWADSSASVEQRNIGVTLSYLLYDFGARSANLEAAKQLLVAASANQESTVQALFIAAVQAFYQVQAALAALDAASESERAAKESLAAAEARFTSGSATRADKLQAQTAYSQATLNRITADGSLKNAQGALANILGLDADRNVPLVTANATLAPANFDADIAALIEEARRRRPDLQAAAAQVKAAQAGADGARATGWPSIYLTASSNQGSVLGMNSHNSTLGINLTVPIFAGYAPTYRVRAAEAQVEARTAQLERLHLQVSLDVWTAYQNLTTATQSLRTTADLLDSAEQSERVALGRYKAGVGSILDVLNAQSALAGARQQRIQSAFNWNISRAILAQAMGNLDAGLLQTLATNTRQPEPQENTLP